MQAPPLQTECLVLTLKPPSVSPANAQRDNGTVREATKAQFSDSKPLTSTWRHAGRLQLMVTFVYRSAFLRSRHRRIAAPLPTRNIAQPKANASGGGRSALPGARGPALPSAPPQPRAPARSPLHPAAHGTAARPDAGASAVLTAPTKRRCRRARPGELRLRPSRSRPAAGFQPVPAQAGRRLSDSLASAESRLSSPLRAPPRSAGAPGRARAEDGGELSAGALRHSGPGRGPRPRPLPRLRPAGRGSADKGRGAGPGSPRAARPPPGPPPRRPPPPAPRRATRRDPPLLLLLPSSSSPPLPWRTPGGEGAALTLGVREGDHGGGSGGAGSAGLRSGGCSGHVFRKHAAPFASPPGGREPPIGGAGANQQPRCSRRCYRWAPSRLGARLSALITAAGSAAGPLLIGGERMHVVTLALGPSWRLA